MIAKEVFWYLYPKKQPMLQILLFLQRIGLNILGGGGGMGFEL